MPNQSGMLDRAELYQTAIVSLRALGDSKIILDDIRVTISGMKETYGFFANSFEVINSIMQNILLLISELPLIIANMLTGRSDAVILNIGILVANLRNEVNQYKQCGCISSHKKSEYLLKIDSVVREITQAITKLELQRDTYQPESNCAIL